MYVIKLGYINDLLCQKHIYQQFYWELEFILIISCMTMSFLEQYTYLSPELKYPTMYNNDQQWP